MEVLWTSGGDFLRRAPLFGPGAAAGDGLGALAHRHRRHRQGQHRRPLDGAHGHGAEHRLEGGHAEHRQLHGQADEEGAVHGRVGEHPDVEQGGLLAAHVEGVNKYFRPLL